MKVWITKYLFTKGIIEIDGAEVREDIHRKVVKVPWARRWNGSGLFFGGDWHKDYQSARERAMRMIYVKRASLERQMAKLDSIDLAANVVSTKDGET